MRVKELTVHGEVVGYRFSFSDQNLLFDVDKETIQRLGVSFKGLNGVLSSIQLRYFKEFDSYLSAGEFKKKSLVEDKSGDTAFLIEQLAIGSDYIHPEAIRKYIENKKGLSTKAYKVAVSGREKERDSLIFVTGERVPRSIFVPEVMDAVGLTVFDKDGGRIPYDNVHCILFHFELYGDYRVHVEGAKNGVLLIFDEIPNAGELQELVELSKPYHYVIEVE